MRKNIWDERGDRMEEFVKLKDITKVYHMGEVEIRAADNINSLSKKESLL